MCYSTYLAIYITDLIEIGAASNVETEQTTIPVKIPVNYTVVFMQQECLHFMTTPSGCYFEILSQILPSRNL